MTHTHEGARAVQLLDRLPLTDTHTYIYVNMGGAGGFNINHDLAGAFAGPADKMVVTQCREVRGRKRERVWDAAPRKYTDA